MLKSVERNTSLTLTKIANDFIVPAGGAIEFSLGNTCGGFYENTSDEEQESCGLGVVRLSNFLMFLQLAKVVYDLRALILGLSAHSVSPTSTFPKLALTELASHPTSVCCKFSLCHNKQ